MTKEQIDDLCRLIRAYNRARTDCILMSAMLNKAEASGVPQNDWLKHLKMLRELPEHRAVREETERLLAQVRRTVDEDALTKLISHIQKSTLPD